MKFATAFPLPLVSFVSFEIVQASHSYIRMGLIIIYCSFNEELTVSKLGSSRHVLRAWFGINAFLLLFRRTIMVLFNPIRNRIQSGNNNNKKSNITRRFWKTIYIIIIVFATIHTIYVFHVKQDLILARIPLLKVSLTIETAAKDLNKPFVNSYLLPDISRTIYVCIARVGPWVERLIDSQDTVINLEINGPDLFLPGGAVAQSVERATPGEEVPGSIPVVATRSLLVGSVSV